MRLVIALTAVLVASMALATPTTHGPGSNATGPYEYEPTRDIKWMQLPLVDPLSSSPASQFAPDYPFYAETADDFECLDGDPIVGVEWWGLHFNVPGDQCAPDYFVIRFYEYVFDVFSQPGALLAQYDCYDYNEEYDVQYEQYNYFCDLDTPFLQVLGEYYFISIQAVMPFGTCGQWGWCECDPMYYWGDEGVMDFEALGIPRWTQFSDPILFGYPVELAFVLYGPGTPVEQATWGSIKALYR